MKSISLTVAVLVIAFTGFQMAEPAAAVKAVDHFTRYQPDSQYGNIKMVTTTQQYNKDYLTVKTAVYKKTGTKYVFWQNWGASLKKVSNTRLQINEWPTLEGPKIETHYVTTKLTAVKYYWKVYRAQI